MPITIVTIDEQPFLYLEGTSDPLPPQAGGTGGSGSGLLLESGASAKLSALAAATSPVAGNLIYIVQAGVGKQLDYATLLTALGGSFLPLAGGTLTGALLGNTTGMFLGAVAANGAALVEALNIGTLASFTEVGSANIMFVWNSDPANYHNEITNLISNDATQHAMRFKLTAAGVGTTPLTLHASGNAEVAGIFAALQLRQSQTALTYAATTDIDLNLAGFRTLSLTGNVTFTTSNRAASSSVSIKILCDATPRTFTFPAWKFMGTAPTGIAAGKTGILSITAFGTADTDVVAAYAVEA